MEHSPDACLHLPKGLLPPYEDEAAGSDDAGDCLADSQRSSLIDLATTLSPGGWLGDSLRAWLFRYVLVAGHLHFTIIAKNTFMGAYSYLLTLEGAKSHFLGRTWLICPDQLN